MSALSTASLRALHDDICLVRAFERVVADAYRDQQLRGLLHLSAGAEAVCVGLASRLRPGDRLYSTHRPHGHFVATGADPRDLLAELAGRETGICRGRGGSMHLMSEQVVMATGVVGGTLPIAVGHAMTVADGDLVIVFFGDGAAQNGVFHESLNLAALWQAPVLFVCENNGWAEFTSREEHTNVPTVSAHGELYGMPTRIVDGADVEAVITAANELMPDVRERRGPAMLECNISRLRSHYEGDARRLMSTDENASDPLARTRARLLEQGVPGDELDATLEEAITHMRRLLDEVLADPLPDPGDDLGLVFERARP